MSEEASRPNVISIGELTLNDGKILVSTARRAIETYLERGEILKITEDIPQKLLKRGMCFVTLLRYPSNDLRGCIGYTQPIEPLIHNVVSAAIAAATEDPRFPPMTLSELDKVIIEVSVLSVPTEIRRHGREILGEIVIGRDGLIIDYGIYKGLLLPEVPVEYCWDAETFVSETCIKAGLPPDCWLSSKVRVLRFEARTFRELRPKGPVIERSLRDEYVSKCPHLV